MVVTTRGDHGSHRRHRRTTSWTSATAPAPAPVSAAPSDTADAAASPQGKPLELRVQRQILWVGSAAVPLRNVSWVEVFRLKPAWGKAGVYFLLLVALAFLVSARLDSTDGAAAPPRAS